MTMELNRRIFLALLGAAATLPLIKGKSSPVPRRPVATSGGIGVHSIDQKDPTAAPRTAAIIYFPVGESPD